MMVLGLDLVQMETVQVFPHEYSMAESDDKVSSNQDTFVRALTTESGHDDG